MEEIEVAKEEITETFENLQISKDDPVIRDEVDDGI
jgi:hypothetical protein